MGWEGEGVGGGHAQRSGWAGYPQKMGPLAGQDPVLRARSSADWCLHRGAKRGDMCMHLHCLGVARIDRDAVALHATHSVKLLIRRRRAEHASKHALWL